MNYPINQWIELESFEIYRDWKTPQGFLCGTYASSVLLAYWQDQLDADCLPNGIREKNSPQFMHCSLYYNRLIFPQFRYRFHLA